MKSAAFLVACASVALAVSAAPTLKDLVTSTPELSTLQAALSAAGLLAKLDQPGPFTLFAPTNEAFTSAPMAPYKAKFLLDPDNVKALGGVLGYHLSPRAWTFAQLQSAGSADIETVFGTQSLFAVFNVSGEGKVTVEDSTCGTARLSAAAQTTASNGVLFKSDVVFIPKGLICPDTLFYAEQRGDSRIGGVGYDCRNRGSQTLSRSEIKPVGLAVDSAEQAAFWSNDQSNKPFDSWLSRAYFNGTDETILFSAQLYDPQGLDLDRTARKVYFTERLGNLVSVSNYDASDRQMFLSLNSTEYPTDVAVDSAAGIVFITVTGPQDIEGQLVRQFINGTGKETLLTGLNKAYGLCVDSRRQQVFYVQGGHGGSISCLAYGSDPCDTVHPNGLVVDGLDYPYMCAVDSLWHKYGGPTNLLVSSTNAAGYVSLINSNGTVVGQVVDSIDSPMGVSLGCGNM